MTGVTLSRFFTDRETPQFRISGTLPFISVFSVTRFAYISLFLTSRAGSLQKKEITSRLNHFYITFQSLLYHFSITFLSLFYHFQ